MADTIATVEKPILTLFNNHNESCGTPPVLPDSKSAYVAYFENEHGEQTIFIKEQGKQPILYMGDYSWEKPLIVQWIVDTKEKKRDPEYKGHVHVENLRMDFNENMWLTACYLASTAFGK